MTDPIAAAMAAAAAQAAATPAATSTTAVAATTDQTTAVATTGQAISMESLMIGSMTVDGWIKPKEFGLLIGDKAEIIPKLKVMLDMTEGVGFIPKMAIKGGNPAQYAYTTNGATAIGGGSWPAAQERIRQLDPKAAAYRAVDLPFTLLEDAMGFAPGNQTPVELAKAGQRLGYTTSTTNWANWETFYRECLNKGLKDKRVELFIGAQKRTNKNNNVWGVMTFELIGEVVSDESE